MKLRGIVAAGMIVATLLIAAMLGNAPVTARPDSAFPTAVVVFNAATTGTSASQGGLFLTQIAGDITFSTGSTAGVVRVEVAPSTTYAGTWNEIFSVDLAAEIAADSVAAPRSFHYTYPGNAGAVRHRFTTNMTGGTCTSYLYGLK